MLALDAHPELIALARDSAHVVSRDGQRTIEAEAAPLSGPAAVVTPTSAWTGESQWSNGAYVHTDAGSSLTWSVPTNSSPQLVQAVLNRVPGNAGTTTFASPAGNLGTAQFGGGGAQGVSAAPRGPASGDAASVVAGEPDLVVCRHHRWEWRPRCPAADSADLPAGADRTGARDGAVEQRGRAGTLGDGNRPRRRPAGRIELHPHWSVVAQGDRRRLGHGARRGAAGRLRRRTPVAAHPARECADQSIVVRPRG